MKYRVRNIDGKFYPERYDKCLGWVGYKVYADFLKFDTEKKAWEHIKRNPNKLNVGCD
jgi:hypothetical protein